MPSFSNISTQLREKILIPRPYETHFHKYTIADVCKSLGMDSGEWFTMKKKVYFPYGGWLTIVQLTALRNSLVETRRAEFFNKDDIDYKRYTWFDLDYGTTECEMLPEIIATYLDGRPDWYQRLEENIQPLNHETITFIKDLLRYKFGDYHGTWRKKWKYKLHVKAALKAKAERAKSSARSGDAETVDTGRGCSTDTTAPHIQVR